MKDFKEYIATSLAISEKRELLRNGTAAPKMREQCKMKAFDAVTWQAALLLEARRKLVTSANSQTKLDKAQATDTGYANRGLTLSSAMEARPFIGGRFTACFGATVSCALACVGSQTGQGALPSSKIARIGRTLAMHVDMKHFNALLDCEIESERMRQAIFGFKLAFRFNVASDHWRLATECAKRNKLVKFYDYSAIPNAAYEHARQIASGNASWDSQPYVQRVYSRKDGPKSDLIARAMLKDGFGISVVFDIKKGDTLPEFWNGSPVIDGDVNDLWFLRAPKDSAFVVGLRVKGSNKQKQQAIDSGFAVKVGA